MDKLKKLADLCKGEVSITINGNRSSYLDVKEELDFLDVKHGEISPEILSEMIRCDTIVHVQFYPHTPVGFYTVFHYDIDQALTKALAILGIQPQE